MRFGYFIGQELQGRDPATAVREAVAEAAAAEEAGFAGVFVSEHHQQALQYLPAPIPLMYLLAAATSTIDVGVAVLLLPLAQPTRVAEELALLDHVSDGRIILGVGMGYIQDDFDAFGRPRAEGPSRLEEGIDVIRRLWSEPSVSYYGRRYQLRDVSVMPPPLRPGGPPIWIGGRSVAGAKRAARSGDAWILDSIPRRQDFQAWYRVYRNVCEKRGRPPRSAILRDGWLYIGSREDADYREAVVTAHRSKIAAGAYDVDPEIAGRAADDVEFDDLAPDRWLVGSATEIHAQLDQWEAALGIEYVLLRFRTRGRPTHRPVLEQIRAFGEEIIAVRDTHGSVG